MIRRPRPSAAHHLLALAFPGRCPGCGAPGEPLCTTCRSTLRTAPAATPPPGVDQWVAAFAYEGVARELVTGAKYHGRHAALVWLARAMADTWRASGSAVPALVTWVPTDPARRRARGIDHARILGRSVARDLGVPARCLLARNAGPAQTGRPVAARREGPSVSTRLRAFGTVLLVDDVATTGATIRVCAAALRRAGATRVLALTAVRTAAPDRGGLSP